MKEIVAIGNPVFDIIETPYIKTNGRVLSGCSTNAALAIGKLGGVAHLIGKVGRDYRNELIKVTEKYKVKAYFLESKETGGFHLIYKGKEMRDRDLFILGVADPIKFEEIPSELLNKDGYVLGPILQEIDADFIEKITSIEDATILLDPQGTIRELENGQVKRVRKEWVIESIKKIDIVKPNEHEAEVLFPSMSLEKVAAKIQKLNGKIGIVTLADRGSYIAFDNKVYHVPAYRTVERDPTGCGDVYGGSYLYWYLKEENPLEAAIFASAAASYMVESTGPDFPLPLDGVLERYEKLKENIRRIL